MPDLIGHLLPLPVVIRRPRPANLLSRAQKRLFLCTECIFSASRAQNRPFLNTDTSLPRHLSSKLALSEDGSQFFCHLSSKPPFFEDRQSPSKAFSAGSSEAGAVQAKNACPSPPRRFIRLRRPAAATPNARPPHTPRQHGQTGAGSRTSSPPAAASCNLMKKL